jgi:hypothetical protein
LSLQCRWGGHISKFFSVAEHCINVSYYVPEEVALQGLLHDAAEAYVGDCITPLKDQLPAYKKIEDRLHHMIFTNFGVKNRLLNHKHISWADAVMISTEADALFPGSSRFTWLKDFPPPDKSIEIQCYEPIVAEQLFLKRFHELMAAKGDHEIELRKVS